MFQDYQLLLILLSFINNPSRIEGRCGYPELPFMATSIETKEFYEESETLKISCIGGIVVGQTMSDVIQCIDNTWNTTSLRCSQLQNLTAMDITHYGKKEEIPNLKEQEFIYLTDNNPMTCVLFEDEEQWVLHLDTAKYVSNVAIIATFINDQIGRNSTNISVSLWMNERCHIEENANRPDSPIVFLIYKCPTHTLAENVSIDLEANGNDINVCGLEIFTIIDSDCGKPELPLYTFADQMRIQNGTKIAEYVCAEGYRMNGSALRTCGKDGLWYPSKPPTCLPHTICNRLEEINETFRFEYKDLNLFGNAMPMISTLTYHCLNETDIISVQTVRYCQKDGYWSPIKRLPVCHPRSHVIVVFGKHFLQDKHLIYYGATGLVILFVGSAIILFHMRRLAKRISRQMRENAYLQQEKALPNYNNESNYQDISTLFNADSTNAAVPQTQQNEPKF